MRAESIPIIRLQLENMTHAICSSMGINNSDLEKLIHKKVNEFNIEKQIEEIVRQEVGSAIRRACEDYFKYGEGNEMVVESVKKIIRFK